MNTKQLAQLRAKISRYREKKENNIFDDFYHSDLDLMEELIDNEIERIKGHVALTVDLKYQEESRKI